MALRWRESVPWRTLTTFKTGGTVARVAEVTDVPSLQSAIAAAAAESLPYLILGSGSNVLPPDTDYKGVVILPHIRGIVLKHESVDNVVIDVGAGELLDDVVAWSVEHGYWGLENLSAIPGTVGATPVQNVGAYGVEVSELIETVRVYDPITRLERTVTNAECQFSYRDSFFKSAAGRALIIINVTYRLSRHPLPIVSYPDLVPLAATGTPSLHAVRSAIVDIRSRKFPDWRQYGTAGSFFKNPIISQQHYQELCVRYPGMPGHPLSDGRVKVSLGWILDQVCDAKGVRHGVVGTHATQALVLVNYGGASTADVLVFAKTLAQCVQEKTGIVVESEVTVL